MTALLLKSKNALTPPVFDASYELVQISECGREAINDVLATDELASQRGS